MSSTWGSAAESWLKGEIEVEVLVVEAALEGALTELENFFQKHPPSIEYLGESPGVS